MNLKILIPNETIVDETINKISAESRSGSFTVLPRHIDFVAALVPGILAYVDEEDQEHFLAVDEGVLVKRGDEVLVSSRRAFESPELGKLRDVVEGMEDVTEERSRIARNTLARLEINIVRRFMELGD